MLGRYYYNELSNDVKRLARARKLAEQIIMEIKHAPGSNNLQSQGEYGVRVRRLAPSGKMENPVGFKVK